MRPRLTRRLKLLILAGIALLIGWALGVLPPRQDVQAQWGHRLSLPIIAVRN